MPHKASGPRILPFSRGARRSEARHIETRLRPSEPKVSQDASIDSYEALAEKLRPTLYEFLRNDAHLPADYVGEAELDLHALTCATLAGTFLAGRVDTTEKREMVLATMLDLMREAMGG